MTDENPSAAPATPQTATDPNAPVVTPQALYIKDCSFEAPNGPFMPSQSEPLPTPTVSLNLGTKATQLGQDTHEVILQVNLEAKAGEQTVWLLELQQAGAFLIRNLSANDVSQVLSVMAPTYLMAYARATVSDLVTKGGFPPFLLPLVTFEGLQAQAAQQRAAAQAAGQSPAVN